MGTGLLVRGAAGLTMMLTVMGAACAEDGVTPDTILLGESTNDAVSDLQGDGWHGAMTYPSFTRPLWGWLSEPTGVPYLDADGGELTESWFFGQPIGGIPRYSARQFAEAVTRFTAGIPWRVRLGNMQPLDTHDTARFATNAAPGAIPVAVGLSLTMPGLPVVFAGDEFGLTGADGEESRTPMPWGTEAEPGVAERIALYRDLIALRRDHPALQTGGFRWVHVDDDALVYLRETPGERVLVALARALWDGVTLHPALVGPGGAERLHGSLDLSRHDGGARLAGDGPAVGVWRLG